MFRFHFRRNLRSFVFLLITMSLMAGIGVLWWANHTGLPDVWRQAIEKGIEEKGAHVRIGFLSIDPLRGLIASDVRVFSDSSHRSQLATLDRVTFDFDKPRLARGKVLITRVELVNGSLRLPVDPANPQAGLISATRLHGTLFMPGDRRFEFRRARGIVAGIAVTLDARFIGWRAESQHKPDPEAIGRRRELIGRVIGQLQKWKFDRKSPPQLDIIFEGDLNQSASLRAKTIFTAGNVERNGHLLKRVEVHADLEGDLVNVSRAFANDARGKAAGRADFDLSERTGRFSISSSLDLPPLLRSWAASPGLPDFQVRGKQTLIAEGSFSVPRAAPPAIDATGKIECEKIDFRNVRFNQASTQFAWNNGALFLRELVATNHEDSLRGKILINRPLVRVDFTSTLPFSSYLPLLDDQPILESVIQDFQPARNAHSEIHLAGEFDTDAPAKWKVKGEGRLSHMSFRGVPLHRANCHFDLDHDRLDFHSGEVEFDYSGYPLRKTYDGPTKGHTKVGRILYDNDRKLVEIRDVSGTMWPIPLVNLFAAQISPALEPYRFHKPPALHGDGIVDVTSRGRTNLTVAFSSPSAADYELFGKSISLTAPSGKVLIRGNSVEVRDLETRIFDGPAGGTIVSDSGKLSVDLHWSDLSIPEIGERYEFEVKGGGRATGRIECTLHRGNIATTQGKGLLAIDQAELFSVPMFGPLSSLISNALNDERSSYQRATSAFFTFRIRDGVLSTDDFQTSTRSLTFAGDGHIDLRDMSLEMTMRMNARGLLNLLTLPLKPFYGMFQFRGSGPLRKPEWKNVMFTRPPREQQNILSAPPKARPVTETNEPPRATIVD